MNRETDRESVDGREQVRERCRNASSSFFRSLIPFMSDSLPFLCPCESEQWDVWASEGAARRILALSSSWSLTLINESADMGRMLRKAPEDLRGVKGGRGYGRVTKNMGCLRRGEVRAHGLDTTHESWLTIHNSQANFPQEKQELNLYCTYTVYIYSTSD